MAVFTDNLDSMGKHVELTIDWWRHTVEIVPHAAAFVDGNNRFVFANRAFCELVERSSSELMDLTWLDITPKEDQGDDASEIQTVIQGETVSYYDSKSYIMPTGARKPVGIWVNRHPQHGSFQGFVVFCRPRETGASAADVQHEFESVRGQIAILEEQAKAFTQLERRIEVNQALTDQRLVELNLRFDRIERAINVQHADDNRRPSVSIGGDYTGRDQDRSRNNAILMLGVAVVVLGIAAILFGGMFQLRGGGGVNLE